MLKLIRRTNRLYPAAFILLLIGSAAAVARSESGLIDLLASRAQALGLVNRPVIQEVAANRPLVKLWLAGSIERGGRKVSIEKAGLVKPGEVVSFTMNSVNEGSAPARQYRAVGQIPRGSAFVAESARGDRNAQVSYSIDGGQKFSARPTIDERQPDGSIKKVPAPASMFTQVRFEWADPLVPGAKLSSSYQVRVK